MNTLAPLLHDEEIVLDADVNDRERLFAFAAHLLATQHGLDEAEVLRELLAREKLASTALGHGIAIPHARMAKLTEPACAFVRVHTPIPFGAADGKPVSQFLFLLVPKEADEKHLKLMAAAAGALSDPAVRQELRTCGRCEEARQLLGSWEEAPAGNAGS
ncbi:MAG TPA: PTS sugar transporter subunit IIA [Usitatibacter sp.]|nr:PTS sugar transporter subunit IIA [Usitatibacter sp.]